MKFVVTGTAVEFVRSRASVKNIVTGTAVELVRSRAAFEHIVAGSSFEDAGAGTTVKLVVA